MKKPVLAFIHRNPSELPNYKKENDKKRKEQFKIFRNKVSECRMCRFWNNSKELERDITVSLMKEINKNPQKGWTRNYFEDREDLLTQINDLRLKNEFLENDNLKLKSKVKKF